MYRALCPGLNYSASLRLCRKATNKIPPKTPPHSGRFNQFHLCATGHKKLRSNLPILHMNDSVIPEEFRRKPAHGSTHGGGLFSFWCVWWHRSIEENDEKINVDDDDETAGTRSKFPFMNERLRAGWLWTMRTGANGEEKVLPGERCARRVTKILATRNSQQSIRAERRGDEDKIFESRNDLRRPTMRVT